MHGITSTRSLSLHSFSLPTSHFSISPSPCPGLFLPLSRPSGPFPRHRTVGCIVQASLVTKRQTVLASRPCSARPALRPSTDSPPTRQTPFGLVAVGCQSGNPSIGNSSFVIAPSVGLPRRNNINRQSSLVPWPSMPCDRRPFINALLPIAAASAVGPFFPIVSCSPRCRVSQQLETRHQTPSCPVESQSS